MQPIGERLEEARKRQGISIREAADATKVRSDFLLNYESNTFDFDLPDVYKVGFLKLYARFLKLDENALQADLEAALVRQRGSASRRDTRSESLGRFEINERRKAEGKPPAKPAVEAEPEDEHEPAPVPAKERALPQGRDADSTLYVKAGLAIVGVVAIFFLLFILVRLILSGDPVDSPGTEVIEATTPAAETQPSEPTSQTFTIVGTGNTSIRVTQSDGQVIYQGPITNGQRMSLTSTGPAFIASTDIERVVVEIDGRTLRSGRGTTGAARFRIE